MMKNILLVSYSFPPLIDAESIITSNYVRTISQLGYRMSVLTGIPVNRREDTSSISRIPVNVKVFRARSIEDYAFQILSKINLSDTNTIAQISSREESEKDPLILSSLKKMKLLPNHVTGWQISATAVGKSILRNEDFDCLISRSNPITSHLIALRLKAFSKLPWIACFSDPWTLDPSPPYGGRFLSWEFIKILNERLEKKVIEMADIIVLTTDDQKRLYQEKYRLEREKFLVIPNSYDPNERIDQEFSKRVSEDDGIFTIVHAGHLGRQRSPEQFLKAVALIKRDYPAIANHLKIVFIGDSFSFDNLISNYDLRSITQTLGRISKEEAVRHCSKADLLLLIDAPSKERSMFLPSKLLDYMRLGIPILAITPVGSAADIISSTRTGKVISSYDHFEIAEEILHQYSLFKSKMIETTPNLDEIAKYSITKCAETLIGIIETISSNSNPKA